MEVTMPVRFVRAGGWFFGLMVAAAVVLVVIAPVNGIRLFGLAGLAFAAAGLTLQLYALRKSDPHALMGLRFWLNALRHHARDSGTHAGAAIHTG
jgi:hypothetical protein